MPSNCPHCGSAVNVYKMRITSGAMVVTERCTNCRKPPNPSKLWTSKAGIDVDALPLFDDYAAGRRCDYRGCTEVGVEYHHFAPQHLFDDANNWPTGNLCMKHHREWHEKTKTGSYWRSK